MHITCELGKECTVLLTTQGSTKVYRMLPLPTTTVTTQIVNTMVTRQTFSATVAALATLALLPEFLTCYRGANYRQNQEIRVARGGNLVLVDWYTSGRMGRGESWAFERLVSETRIYLEDELLLWEPLELQDNDGDASVSAAAAASPSLSLAARMGPYECFCLVVLVGPRLTDVVKQIADTQERPSFFSLNKGRGLSATQQQQQRQRQAVPGQPPACVSSLCRLLEGSQGGVGPGLVLKIAGKATEEVRELLRSLLEPLESVVGSKPYSSM